MLVESFKALLHKLMTGEVRVWKMDELTLADRESRIGGSR